MRSASSSHQKINTLKKTHSFLDFFAGSGLVTEGMKGYFHATWANDICEKKSKVYKANHRGHYFQLGSIEEINGRALPNATLAWASFPCQDLSLAGKIAGIAGSRSGLVWDWLRVIDEMRTRPPILVAENVLGLVAAHEGANYKRLHEALRERGYQSGAIVLNAVRWVPQSRPRVFVIAVPLGADVGSFSGPAPGWPHRTAIIRAAEGLRDWIWWQLPEPKKRTARLQDVVVESVVCDDEKATRRNLALIPERHQGRLLQELANGFKVLPGYKRTRNGKQVLELRFDQVAGCLRTPNGGSSRQVLVLKKEGKLVTRLLQVREAARLMGAPDRYRIPGTYNDGYKAMGDAVAVPVVRFIAKHLLRPLADSLSG